MKKLLLAALTLWTLFGIPSRQAFSQEVWADGHVDIIHVNPEGEFVFHLKENLKLCNNGNGLDWITVNKNYATAEGIKNLLSTVMAAQLADRAVAIQSSSGDPNVEWGCRLNLLGLK